MDHRSPAFECWPAPDSSHISPELLRIQAEPSNPGGTTAPPTSGNSHLCKCFKDLSSSMSTFLSFVSEMKHTDYRYLQMFHGLQNVPAVCLKGRLTLLYSHSMYRLLHLQKQPISHFKIP